MKKILLVAIALFTTISTFAQAPTNGLVSYYPFNGNANDVSGNGNHGVLQNGIAFGNDRFGGSNRAALFDGMDDYITINNSELLQNPSSFLTFSVWIKLEKDVLPDGQGVVPIISKNNRQFNFSQWGRYSLNLNAGINSNYQGINHHFSNQINKNEWINIISVVNRVDNLVYLFINGIKYTAGGWAVEDSYPDSEINIGLQRIGAYSNNNTFLWKGLLDDIRIYNRALTDTEVQALYQAEAPPIDITTGLVANYKMDGNAQDASGNSNHGTAQNGVTFGTDRFGNAGKAASFDGVDDYVQATSSNPLITITTSFWFKPSNLNIQTPFCMGVDDGIGGSPTLNGISLFVQSNVVKIFSSDQQQIPTGYSFPSANQWYFISIQQNAGQYKMFVNSSLVFTGSGAIPRPATQIRIGSATNIRFFNGLMDEIRIYNRALSDAEVAELYRIENSGEILTIPIKPSLGINPTSPTLGSTISVNGTGFRPNSTVTVSLIRDIPNFLQPNQTITTDNLGKFSVIYNSIDGFGTYTANATDTENNSASIKFSPSDGGSNVKIIKPFNGERVPQVNTSGPYPFQLVWNDRITPTNSTTGTENNRTVTYLISYKLFNATTWSSDISVVKTLPYGNQENITTAVNVPSLGTYSIRIKHQGASGNYIKVDNVVIEQLVAVNYTVSLSNSRFTTPIKGLVADGVSRVKLRYEIEPSIYPVKTITVSLTDPIGNKTTKEILGTITDARGIADAFADSPSFNPTFAQSFTMSNITGTTHDFWYIAPTDFSDGSAFLTDALRKVKVTFTVTYNQNGTDVVQVNTYDIQIARPPIMMVGGIAIHAEETFKEFTNYMNTYYKRYLYDLNQSLVRVNPGSGINSYDPNRSDFATNASFLLKGNGIPNEYGTKTYKDIIKIMRNLGFVCHRVDYIGHGMGANLAHASAILESGNPFFRTSDTYEAGYINKNINLNAQKNGSPLMDLIEFLLNEINKNPVTISDLTPAVSFIKNYQAATPTIRKQLRDGASVGGEGKILSILTTRMLLYYTLAKLELPYIRHFIKKVPRTQPLAPSSIISEFEDELGKSEDLRQWFEKLPNQFFTSTTKLVNDGFDHFGYWLKGDSLVLSDAANELRNNETNLSFNRTILTPLDLPKSGIHYIVGDLVGGADTTLTNASNWFVENGNFFDEYSKVLESISKAVGLIDNVSDYNYILSKYNYQEVRKSLWNRKDKDKLYRKWRDNNRVPAINDQAVIDKYQKLLEYLEMPAEIFKLIGTATNVLTFVFNSDGIAATSSQSAASSTQPMCSNCVSKFPSAFDPAHVLDGLIKYNYFSLPKQHEVFLKIEDLLNASIGSNLFDKTLKQPNFAPSGINPTFSVNTLIGNKPSNNSSLNTISTLFGKTLIDTSKVVIKTPYANSTFNVGQNINVWVELKDTLKFANLVLSFQDKEYIQIEKKRSYLFNIPVNPSENSELLQAKVTYNYSLDSTLFVVDRLRINTNSSEALSSLKVNPDLIEVLKGQEFQQGVLLTYPSYDLTIPINSNFTISISDTNIIKFDYAKNIFIAKENGSVNITLTYKSQVTNFVIIVSEPLKKISPFTTYGNTCLGKSIKVSWTKTGIFSPNSTYYLELSNANGDFTSPIILTSGVNINEAVISLPLSIPSGNNYQIRIRTNLENYISSESIKLKIYNASPLESTKTGYWVDPSTWSCGEVPSILDNVIIKNLHKVELLPNQSGRTKSLVTEHETILNLGLGSTIEIKN